LAGGGQGIDSTPLDWILAGARREGCVRNSEVIIDSCEGFFFTPEAENWAVSKRGQSPSKRSESRARFSMAGQLRASGGSLWPLAHDLLRHFFISACFMIVLLF